MPILSRIAPFLPQGCPHGIYAVSVRLSPGCPPGQGRLHTCYSPVRRSPAEKASFLPAAPRLACVKPAASVHPEPGSNSPLFIVFSIFSCSSRCPAYSGCLTWSGFRRSLSFSRLPLLSSERASAPLACCRTMSLFSCAHRSRRCRLSRFASAKLMPFYFSRKLFHVFFDKKF